MAALLEGADPDLVVATWGGTARGEMTRCSDLDLLCWNPGGQNLPDLPATRFAYLDLVTCSDDRSALATWAKANATDLHAVMFSRCLAGSRERVAQFEEVRASLWQDFTLRAREIFHLVATSIRVASMYGQTLYRPEKFSLGATRCWTVLAECGQLFVGTQNPSPTDATLLRMTYSGLASPQATPAFTHAMKLRRMCEDGEARFADLDHEYKMLADQYLGEAARLLLAITPWIQRHAPLSSKTLDRLSTELLRVPSTANPDVIQPKNETEAMMSAFLAADAEELESLLQPGASWWVRHAAILNPASTPTVLHSIIDDIVHGQTWWPDRNLILYAIRHPAADKGLLDRLRALEHRLRPMDIEALTRRFTDFDTRQAKEPS